MKNLKPKQIIGMVAAVVVIVASYFIPPFIGLTELGVRTVGFLVAFLLMLITEALPVVVTSILFLGLMAVLGIVDGLGSALYGFSQPIVFFTLASFGIAAAITGTPLSNRILHAMMRFAGSSVERVLLLMMIACALVSSMVSNVPTCAIFMTLSLNFIEAYSDPEEKKRTGRYFMIGIPVASMIGGMITPAGSSINLIVIGLLEDYVGATVSFVQWMAVGAPLAIIMIPFAWFVMSKVYKPAPLSKEAIEAFDADVASTVPKKMDSNEVKVVVIVAIMLVFWIASSWVPAINVMVVALLGCAVMFLPGIDILDVDTFIRENSWDAFFLVGTVLSVANAMMVNGVSQAIADVIPVMNVSTPVLIAFTAVLIFACLVVIPVATSLLPIMVLPLIAIAEGAGVSPVLILLTASLCACNCYLLPLDTVPLITYSKGYYSMTDMAKSTIFMQIALVILCAIWLPIIGGVLGMV